MVRLLVYILLFLFSTSLSSQLTINPNFEKRIDELIEHSVPIISITEASDKFENYTFLDTRELEEYETSHIKGALFVGYDNFSISNLNFAKSENLIVYCSVGYRSEIIGKKLKDSGYQNVYNLYGSIFEWVNQGYPVVDSYGNNTDQLHTYNHSWSKWVEASRIKKVW